jgi:acetylornithine deacetylase
MNSYLYDLLENLIAFNTVSANSDLPAAQYLADHLASHDFRAELHRVQIGGVQHANVVAWAGPPRPDGLVISGHIDTVPVEGQPGWERDPFKMDVNGDRIYGRGTTDMKGFLAQCVDAARAFQVSRLKRPLVFVFTADEEVGMLGAQRVAPELQQILGETPCPRFTWIGEPTSFGILHAHKSIGAFEIKVHGRGGHSGAPEQGVNAIAIMGKVLETIGQIQTERRSARSTEFAEVFPENPYDVMNFGTISGGIAANVIAEECSLRVSYRSLPKRDPMEVYRETEKRLAKIDTRDYASANFSATIEMGKPMIAPAMFSPRGTALEKALAEVTGAKTAQGAPFATDGAWFAGVGMTSLICGPGDYDQAHRPNESIGRAAFERGPAMILEVIDKICCS